MQRPLLDYQVVLSIIGDISVVRVTLLQQVIFFIANSTFAVDGQVVHEQFFLNSTWKWIVRMLLIDNLCRTCRNSLLAYVLIRRQNLWPRHVCVCVLPWQANSRKTGFSHSRLRAQPSYHIEARVLGAGYFLGENSGLATYLLFITRCLCKQRRANSCPSFCQNKDGVFS